MIKLILVLLGTVATASAEPADDIADLAKAKCIKCHGNTEINIDGLGGQPVAYMFKAMKDYQSGARHSRHAKWYMPRRLRYDDATLQALANYLSKTTPQAPIAGDPKLVALGKELYENGAEDRGVQTCADCHGDEGEGYGKNPRLAGLSTEFFIEQMENYKVGNIDNQKRMANIAGAMTEEEILAVATYMRSK